LKKIIPEHMIIKITCPEYGTKSKNYLN